MVSSSSRDEVAAAAYQKITQACCEAENGGAPKTLDICRLYDELLSFDNTSSRQMETGILRLRLLTEKETIQSVTIAMAAEADFYRAITLISYFLLQKLPARMASTRSQIENNLARATLLLNLLEKLYTLVQTDQHILPSSYPNVETIVFHLKRGLDSSDTNLIIFSRGHLEAEEGELCRMANAPIPNETQQEYGPSLDKKLSARTRASDSVYVELRSPGIIRICQPTHSIGTNQWWALTSNTSISYQAPTVSITCVTANSDNLTSTTLSLDVGKDGDEFSQFVTKIVFQLKLLRSIHAEIAAQWLQQDNDEVLSQAFRNFCPEQNALH